MPPRIRDEMDVRVWGATKAPAMIFEQLQCWKIPTKKPTNESLLCQGFRSGYAK